MSAVEIRFNVDGLLTPWETESVRYPTMGQTPTAVRRVNELRAQHPDAAIAIERRGVETRPRAQPTFRFRIFVKEGSMPLNDPLGVGGIRVTSLRNTTLFSRPFQESERDAIRAQVMEMFPKAELSEVST